MDIFPGDCSKRGFFDVISVNGALDELAGGNYTVGICLPAGSDLFESEAISLRQIPISDINGVRIGCAEDQAGKTGCTVLLCGGADGAPAGVDVRGGGPASRETELLRPWAAAERIHAVLLFPAARRLALTRRAA